MKALISCTVTAKLICVSVFTNAGCLFSCAAAQIRAVAGQRSSPDLCFVTKSIKSTTKDIDLIVTQVGCDGTA